MVELKYILFDCDNTLVLSEALAFEACASLANTILAKNSIADRFTGPQLLTTFVGMNFRGMLLALCEKYDITLSPTEIEYYVKEEENEVIATLTDRAQPCEGVDAVLEKLEKENKYLLSVVSSSALRRVVASLKKVGQDGYFGDRVFSAATSLDTPTSKPNPAIYLHAMKTLRKDVAECVAVEDSRSGTLAAVRAGIKTIGYVGSYDEEEERKKMVGVLKETGAKVVMTSWEEFEEALKQVEAM